MASNPEPDPISPKNALKRIRSSSLPRLPPCIPRTRSLASAVSHVSFADSSGEEGDLNDPCSLSYPDSEGLASDAVRAGLAQFMCNLSLKICENLIRSVAAAASGQPRLAGDSRLPTQRTQVT